MHANARKDHIWMGFCQGKGVAAGWQIASWINNARHSTRLCRLNHSLAVIIKAGSINVCVAVGEHSRHPFLPVSKHKKGRGKAKDGLSLPDDLYYL
jgi:hypothetical protein